MNGTKQLIDSLFKGNEDAFIEHFVKSCLFLPKKVVEKRANEILTDISNNIKVSVRFGKKYLSEFEAEPKRNALRKKSKSEIKKIAENETLLFKDEKVKVLIDGTGNQTVVAAIEKGTGYIINSNSSDLKNFTLSHIWESTTHNPYYFSSLWNIVIIPNYLNYIMDKPQSQDKINETIQELMKAICIELYNPNTLMQNKIQVPTPKEKFSELAKKAIHENWITFLDEKDLSISTSEEKISVDKNIFKDINKLNNKAFVFKLLQIMEDYGLLEDNLATLTDIQECKENLGHNFPILLEANGENSSKDNNGRDRYYPNDLFEYNGKKYYVTNDWYEKTKEKSSNRDNRPLFLSWISSLLDE
jgi:hypothetical protein